MSLWHLFNCHLFQAQQTNELKQKESYPLLFLVIVTTYFPLTANATIISDSGSQVT